MKSILMTLVCVLLASPLWAQTFEDIPVAQTLTTTSNGGDVRILVRTEENAIYFSRKGFEIPTDATWTRFPFPIGQLIPDVGSIWYDVQELVSMTTVGDDTFVVMLTDQGVYSRFKTTTQADGTEIFSDFVVFDPLQEEIIVEPPPEPDPVCSSWWGFECGTDPNCLFEGNYSFTPGQWCDNGDGTDPYLCSGGCPAP